MHEWTIGAFQNFATEAFGAALIILVVDWNLSRFQAQIDQIREKEALIFQMSNPNDNGMVLEAVGKLWNSGWLKDGSLAGKSFAWAKLQTANLIEADLRRADLGGADLTGANLWYSKLQGAILGSANLTGSNLGGANIEGADLYSAKMEETIFNEQTILPDGTNWTPDADVRRFWNSAHPDFWRSDDPQSPAYRPQAESGEK